MVVPPVLFCLLYDVYVYHMVLACFRVCINMFLCVTVVFATAVDGAYVCMHKNHGGSMLR